MNEILSLLSNNLSKYNSEKYIVEGRVIFRDYLADKKFNYSLVDRDAGTYFTRLSNFLVATLPPAEEVVTEDKYYGNGIKLSKDFKTGEEVQVLKETVWPSGKDPIVEGANEKFAYDFVVQKEEREEVIGKIVEEPIRVRIKNRRGYIRKSSRIDLTKVQETFDNVTYQKYEVSIVMNTADHQSFKIKLDEFRENLDFVFCKMRETRIPYSLDHLGFLIREISRKLSDPIGPKYYLEQSLFSKPRNLKVTDLVHGGLVGNLQTYYVVMHKVDGIRKLFVYDQTGIWLVGPPLDFNLVVSPDKRPRTVTIIDGELIPAESRRDQAPKSEYWYIAFDCLVTANTILTKSTLDVRHRALNITAQQIAPTELFTFTVKNFYPFSTLEDIYKATRGIFKQIDYELLAYKTNGLIFAPNNTGYNPGGTSGLSMGERIKKTLTKVPDLCKWKPKDQITINFSISWSAQGLEPNVVLRTARLTSPSLALFEGTDLEPLENRVSIRRGDFVLSPQNHPNGSIIEFGWDPKENLLVPIKSRLDKVDADTKTTAEDNWNEIFFGLDKETLRGESLQLYDEYFNRLVSRLYQRAADRVRANRNLGSATKLSLLEIGYYSENTRRFGEFGDILVIDVDVGVLAGGKVPRRYQSLNIKEFTPDVISRVTGTYDIIAISPEMMSLGWQRLDIFSELLLNKLADGGVIIFLTFDGDLIDAVFDHPLTAELKDSAKLSLTKLDFVYTPLRLLVTRHDLGVTKEYYPVRLRDLTLAGFSSFMISRADKEQFLSLSEKIFASILSYGIFSLDYPVLPPLAIEPIPRILTPSPAIIAAGVAEAETIPASDPLKLVELSASVIPEKIIEPTSVVTVEEISDLPAPDFLPPSEETTINLNSVPPPEAAVLEAINPISVEPEEVEEEVERFGIEEEVPAIGKQDDPIPKLPVIKEPPELPKPQKLFNYKWIPVVPRDNLDEPAINDDTLMEYSCDFYPEKLYRIATIGDGSCFFHGILKASLPRYQNTSSFRARTAIVKEFRRALSEQLDKINPATEKTYYESAAGGSLASLAIQQQNSELKLDVDFSLAGLKELIAGSGYIGDELYALVADILNIDVVIVSYDKCIVLSSTIAEGSRRRVVALYGNTEHYEVLAASEDTYLQTLFSPEHPLAVAIRSQPMGIS